MARLRRSDPEWLGELQKLISALNAIEPLHRDALRALRQAHLLRFQLRGEEIPDFASLYADSPSVRYQHIDDAPGQIRALTEAFIHYLSVGDGLDATLAVRLCERIRAAKRTDVELAFLEAYNRHFGSTYGELDRWLMERMEELRRVHKPQRRFRALHRDRDALVIRGPRQ